MQEALHPHHDNRSITVDDHILEFGNDSKKVAPPDRARCPICKQYLKIVSPSSPNTIKHFSHISGGGWCPAKEIAKNPYLGLSAKSPDIEMARRIKHAFAANWQRHYDKLRSLVPYLSLDEFTEILKIANREKIWYYKDINEGVLPYIFATLIDFTPDNSYKKSRKYWLCFLFDNTVRGYDDLWIYRDVPLKFWRASFSKMKGKSRPKLDDLVRITEVEISDDFLKGDVPLNSYIEKYVSDWLARNF